MRVIAEETHLGMRISLFRMNQKFIVKLELGPMEQVYKLSDFDFIFADQQEALLFAKNKIAEPALEIFKKMSHVFLENT